MSTITTDEKEKRFFLIDSESLRDVLGGIVEEAIEKHFKKPKEEKMLTIGQVSEMLGVDPSTLWHWNEEGYLKKIHIGGKPRYKESEVLEILDGRTQKRNTKQHIQ